MSNNTFTRSHPCTDFNPFHHPLIPIVILFCKQSILMEHYSLCHPQDQTIQFIPCCPSSFSFRHVMIFFCRLDVVYMCLYLCACSYIQACFVIVIFVVNYFYVLVTCVYTCIRVHMFRGTRLQVIPLCDPII